MSLWNGMEQNEHCLSCLVWEHITVNYYWTFSIFGGSFLLTMTLRLFCICRRLVTPRRWRVWKTWPSRNILPLSEGNKWKSLFLILGVEIGIIAPGSYPVSVSWIFFSETVVVFQGELLSTEVWQGRGQKYLTFHIC